MRFAERAGRIALNIAMAAGIVAAAGCASPSYEPQPLPEASAALPRSWDLADWSGVQPDYRDDVGDTFHRNHRGYGPRLDASAPLSYDEISEALGMKRGSIGPTRQRCMEKLRRHPAVRRVMGDG